MMKNFFALLIGVGGDLPVTVQDVTAVYDLLSDPEKGGYAAENIQLLTEENSNREKVLQSLDWLLTATASVEDATVVVYYSGHGLRFPAENSADGFEYYLKTAGADLNFREETMLRGSVFSEKINRIKAKKMLVLLDCCHADGVGTLKKTAFESMEIVPEKSNRALLEKLGEGEGRVFISACDDAEESVILPGSKNSLFTEVCLEVLNGNLTPGDEFVSVVDLIYFIIKEIPKRVLPFRHVQRPIITQVHHLSPDYFVCRNGNYQPLSPQFESFGEDRLPERLAFIRDYTNKL